MPASEFDLIAAINERLPHQRHRVRVPSGDDAAVVEPRAASAISVDAVVDGVHFRLEDFGAPAVGRKALAAGLSDLAAMGAPPGEAYVVVARPGRARRRRSCSGIADGLAEVATRHGVTVAGGDLVASSGTDGLGDRGRLRARREPPGDEGRARRPRGPDRGDGQSSAAARAGALDADEGTAALPPDLREAMLERQLDPAPRLREGGASRPRAHGDDRRQRRARRRRGAPGSRQRVPAGDRARSDAARTAGSRRSPGATAPRSSSRSLAERTTSCSSRCPPRPDERRRSEAVARPGLEADRDRLRHRAARACL